MRQMHGSLLSEKQAMAKQLQQVTSSIESLKTRISRGEDQVSVQIFFLFFFGFVWAIRGRQAWPAIRRL